MTDYAALYEATALAARIWAWRYGAETRDEVDEAVQMAWLSLLQAAPVLDNATHAAVYLRRCVQSAMWRIRRPKPGVPLALAARLPAPAPALELSDLWAEGAALPGWEGCAARERLALVLTAAGWPNAAIAATAPALYPRPNSVADAAWRARRRILAAHQEAA